MTHDENVENIVVDVIGNMVEGVGTSLEKKHQNNQRMYYPAKQTLFVLLKRNENATIDDAVNEVWYTQGNDGF